MRFLSFFLLELARRVVGRANGVTWGRTEFCGGFNSTGPRSLFPLGSCLLLSFSSNRTLTPLARFAGAGAPILIDSTHTNAQVAIIISFATNPVSFANFTTTPTGTPIPFVLPCGPIVGKGDVSLSLPV